MFGRSRKEDTVQEEVEEEVRPQLYDESELWQIPGPREEYEVDTSVDYVDLGSLLVPAAFQVRQACAGNLGELSRPRYLLRILRGGRGSSTVLNRCSSAG